MSVGTVSIVGLGRLGASMAAAIASKGCRVIGVDADLRTVELVNQGRAPVPEPAVAELMTAHRKRLTATADVTAAVRTSDITLVVVPTPSESHGGFSLRFVLQAAEAIGRALAAKDGYHVVAVVSTVLPGSTRYGVLPVLEAESAKRCGEGFGVCYTPAFVALGSVIRDYFNPDFILVGESDERAGSVFTAWYQALCDRRPPLARMSFENAELTKLAVNTFVTMKISYANMLAELCERLPGGDVDLVTRALGLDSRVGPKYLRGALGYGGPCFPRDNRALEYLATWLECQGTLMAAVTDRVNRAQPERLVAIVKGCLRPPGEVAVLGLAYKSRTPVVEAAQGIAIAQALLATGYRVVVHDRLAAAEAQRVLGDAVRYATSIGDALREADAVVVAGEDEAIPGELVGELQARRKAIVVVDCWRALRGAGIEGEHVRYVPIGVGSDGGKALERLVEGLGSSE